MTLIKSLFEKFINEWPTEKTRLNQEMSNARASRKKNPVESVPQVEIGSSAVVQLLTDNLPNAFRTKTNLPPNDYKFQGSIGQGNLSEIPWLCVFDREISESARKGYYIVYLFKANLSGLYLSLNQGWTQYEEMIQNNQNRIHAARENASTAQKMLRSLQDFSQDSITLDASGDLGKGYEHCNICSKYYSAADLPSDEVLINDLRNLLGVYRELKGMVGLDILSIQQQIDEDDFQQRAQQGKVVDLAPGPQPRNENTPLVSRKNWPRRPEISALAIINAEHRCENEATHLTFTALKSGKNYVEAHHLIPMEFQGRFRYSIDIPENVISLCPHCHRAFHHGEKHIQLVLIMKFFELRRSGLKERSVEIDQKTLIGFYQE